MGELKFTPKINLLRKLNKEVRILHWSYSTGIIANYFFDKQKIEDILVTYIGKTGKAFLRSNGNYKAY